MEKSELEGFELYLAELLYFEMTGFDFGGVAQPAGVRLTSEGDGLFELEFYNVAGILAVHSGTKGGWLTKEEIEARE